MVLKRSGQRQPFDRTKVADGIRSACKGRPVSEEMVDELAGVVDENLDAWMPGTDLKPQRVDRRVHTGPLIGAGIVAVEESDLARIDVPCLDSRPGFSEKLQTIAAGKVGILDEGDRRIGLAPHPAIGLD